MADNKVVPPVPAAAASEWKDRQPEFTEFSNKAGYRFTRGERNLWVIDSHRLSVVADSSSQTDDKTPSTPATPKYKYDATVLFIHGLGGRSEQFMHQMQFILSLTNNTTTNTTSHRYRYRVVAIDLFGHGRSSKPNSAASYHRAEMLADLEAVLHAHQSVRNYVVAHSMGAGLALAMAAHPERTKTAESGGGGSGGSAGSRGSGGSTSNSSSGIVLAAPPPSKITAATAAGGAGATAGPPPVPIDRMLLLGSHPIHIPSSGSALINNCCDCFLNQIRPVIGRAVTKLLYHDTTPKQLIEAEGKISSQNPFYVIRHIGQSFQNPLPLAVMSTIRTPTVLFHGRDDKICKLEKVEPISAALPVAMLETFADTAHNFMLERSEFTSHKIAEFVSATKAELVTRINLHRETAVAAAAARANNNNPAAPATTVVDASTAKKSQ